MIRALFPGSFDPFTIGHLDIAERAAAQVGELVVGVGANPAKKPMFTVEQRVAMASAALAHLGNVRVAALQGATMDAARGLGAALIVKGVRGPDDAAHEAVQAAFNLEAGGIDTWWIPTRPALSHVSSSAVRELFRLGKDAHRYVPPAISRFMTDNRGGS